MYRGPPPSAPHPKPRQTVPSLSGGGVWGPASPLGTGPPLSIPPFDLPLASVSSDDARPPFGTAVTVGAMDRRQLLSTLGGGTDEAPNRASE